MNLIKQRVQHRQFGTGVIVQQSESLIEVLFEENVGTKNFSYPTAFVSFLHLIDPSAQEAMSAENAENQKRTDEMHQAQRDARQRILEEIQAAQTKTKPAKPKAAAKPRAAKPKATKAKTSKPKKTTLEEPATQA